MSKLLNVVLAGAVAFTAALPLASVAEAAVKTGTLTCHVAPGIGLLFGSRRSLNCEFHSSRGNELYTGRIDRIGLDVGITRNSTIVWSVFEPTRRHGDLSGRYTGATAQATVGVGLGANVLVGGGDGSIALQPLSVTTQTGLNVAAGISSLHLTRKAGK
ncbi:DUF992 domain-containing protein [Kaistia dalseonensis]|uniref:DUF992 domain-containing protein n=1 Tax=Kaistia dalseonensis TaxID=410840 RepID=A0ABU0HCD9_9HYPH|nr:DUF992 domain-containing protein [Kaistia dalseonensis]MCX5496903.1 DUF992 domain-containing protein [Kaistia dalseonensis]MDQ0439528.1 hypothetical protein [Kaistia dalseonensis]